MNQNTDKLTSQFRIKVEGWLQGSVSVNVANEVHEDSEITTNSNP
jgi:hypothetical protein